jgi:hypothetical protein
VAASAVSGVKSSGRLTGRWNARDGQHDSEHDRAEYPGPTASPMPTRPGTDKDEQRRHARIVSRLLSLLWMHRLIARVHGTRRSHLTEQGRTAVTALMITRHISSPRKRGSNWSHVE